MKQNYKTGWNTVPAAPPTSQLSVEADSDTGTECSYSQSHIHPDHTWHLLCFGEAELDRDQELSSNAVGPLLLFYNMISVQYQEETQPSVPDPEASRRGFHQNHQTERPDPTHLSFCPDYHHSVCLSHSPSADSLFIFIPMSSVMWFLPPSFPSSTFATALGSPTAFFPFCHLLLTLRHVALSRFFSFCLQKPN